MAGLVVVGYLARRGSMIIQWVFVTLVIQLGAIIVGTQGGRGSFGWVWGKLGTSFAVLIMLLVLAWALTRIGWATQELAFEDWLTGANSRVRLEADLKSALSVQAGGVIALARLDLDSFSDVNNQYGHSTGDAVLQEVSRRIKEILPDSGEVSRLGGDEFGVLMFRPVGSQRASVEDLVSRFLEAVRRPIPVGSILIRLTAAAGIAETTSPNVEPSELLAMADLALYRAKANGGDCAAWYSPEMGSKAIADAQLRQELAVAVSAGDFDLDYQMVVDLDSGQPCGAEALVRWIRAGERITAARFIDYAENSGQIVAIGGLVVDKLEVDAPAILAAAQDPFQLHLNLSVRELVSPHLVHRLTTGPLAEYANRMVVEMAKRCASVWR